MESMSIFTFRKKMLTKKNPLFWIFDFFNICYHTCSGILADLAGRVHKKNAEISVIWEYFGSKFGEMERNRMVATCEHNYGAEFCEDFEVVTTLSRVSIKC
jgi:hypothetical protein